jgi:hypothetical protein
VADYSIGSIRTNGFEKRQQVRHKMSRDQRIFFGLGQVRHGVGPVFAGDGFLVKLGVDCHDPRC